MAISYSDQDTECSPATGAKPPSEFRLWQARFVLRESESEEETVDMPDIDDRSVSSETGNDDDEYVNGSISGEEDDVDNSDEEDDVDNSDDEDFESE